jgi:hypothetical protein
LSSIETRLTSHSEIVSDRYHFISNFDNSSSAFYLVWWTAMPPCLNGQLPLRARGDVVVAAPLYEYLGPARSGCEGSSEPHAILRLNLAGRDLTAWLQKILDPHDYTFTTSVEREIVRDIQDKLAVVAPDFEAELQKAQTTSDCNHNSTLPDSNEIAIANERFCCPELLFKPSFNGSMALTRRCSTQS